MTEITDQDRRDARQWAEAIGRSDAPCAADLWHAASRVILATVDAPAPTLAEDILDAAARIRDAVNPGDRDVSWADMESCANRAEQIEQDRDEARAEVERLDAVAEDYARRATAALTERDEARADAERLTAERDGAREEIAWLRNGPGHTEVATDLPDPAEAERLEGLNFDKQVREAINDHYDQYAVQEAAENNAETPTPADVKPGEAWIVEVNRQKRTAVKDNDAGVPWNTITTNGVFHAEDDDDVTLITRLAPAPRTITNPDDLDRAKRDTIIRDARGIVCSRDSMGTAWSTFTNLADQRHHIILPATVLWEPET